MQSWDVPRLKIRALPPIGRRTPGNTLPQLGRALLTISLSMLIAGAIAWAPMTRHPPAALATNLVARG